MAKLVIHRKRCGHCELGTLEYIRTEINGDASTLVHVCTQCATTSTILDQRYPYTTIEYDETIEVLE